MRALGTGSHSAADAAKGSRVKIAFNHFSKPLQACRGLTTGAFSQNADIPASISADLRRAEIAAVQAFLCRFRRTPLRLDPAPSGVRLALRGDELGDPAAVLGVNGGELFYDLKHSPPGGWSCPSQTVAKRRRAFRENANRQCRVSCTHE